METGAPTRTRTVSLTDTARDRLLTELGWRVLRIGEDAIFMDLEAVVATITRACCT
jgi:very-short-patch-repair endonuclease